MHAVHVVDEELDDHGAVVGRAGGAGREQRDGAGAADRQGGVGGPELGEVLAVPGRPHSGGVLAETGQARDVIGDDVDRDEVCVLLGLRFVFAVRRSPPKTRSLKHVTNGNGESATLER